MFVMALKNGERKMNQFVPKLFDCMKSYTKEQFVKDVISGIIVAIIALPLSIALALASGVGPEQGIYTAIFAGFVISFLGGSNVQIAGPTAAFATIVAGIVARNGMSGLAAATIMAGILLIIMGFLKLGNLIRFIPYTITTGFTFGIAVTILVGQIKAFSASPTVSTKASRAFLESAFVKPAFSAIASRTGASRGLPTTGFPNVFISTSAVRTFARLTTRFCLLASYSRHSSAMARSHSISASSHACCVLLAASARHSLTSKSQSVLIVFGVTEYPNCRSTSAAI